MTTSTEYHDHQGDLLLRDMVVSAARASKVTRFADQTPACTHQPRGRA